MDLFEQILSIIFSFLYGCIINYLYGRFYNFFHYKNKIYSIFNSFLFILDSVLIYFIFMYKINEGQIKIVFIMITLITVLLLNYYSLQKKCKKISN